MEVALEGNHHDAPVYFDPEQELGGQYLKYLILHDDLYCIQVTSLMVAAIMR